MSSPGVGIYTISYSGLWYKDRTLTLEEVFDRAVKFGYKGIEIEAKRPHGSPLDLTAEKVAELKNLASSKGIEICAVAAYNDFTSPVMEHRENQLLMLREQIKLASMFGAKIVRVFTAWQGQTLRNGQGTYEILRVAGEGKFPSVTYLEKWNWVKECLTEATKWAEEHEVILALQNHAPLIENYKDTLDLISEVGSDRLKACIDAPLLINQEDEYVKRAVKDAGELIVHTHFGGEYEKDEKGRIVQKQLRGKYPVTNYRAFIEALAEINYQGWMCYELCHQVLRNHQWVSLEEVDRQVKYAYEFMTSLLQEYF